MRVAMCSIWRNDIDRDLVMRMEHLTAKTYADLHWIWAVGVDNGQDDGTFEAINDYADAHEDKDILVVPSQEGELTGDSNRLARISKALQTCLDWIDEDDDVVLVHESDLISSSDVVERLLAHEEFCVGAWPVLRLNGSDVFYDTWAYRKDGKRFGNYRPYHIGLKAGEERGLYPVDSVGSVWIFPAAEVWKGLGCEAEATLEICRKLAELGYQFWLDPKIIVRQPEHLWIPWSL